MNLFKSTLAATLLLSSLSSYASTISFTSGSDDMCTTVDCVTTTQTQTTWVDPTGTSLDGASWVQTNESWNIDDSNYSIFEIDFSGYTDYILTSLSVSYDDDLIISIGDTVIFDSTDYAITSAWTTITDVFALSTFDTYIDSGSNLTFSVSNSGDHATGVIWSGTATSVPEPSMVIALGLGLVAFGVRRRKSTNI